MCSLKPGIPGISENIRVYSIVGRFLEHSRVYYFSNSEPKIYCASADLMERNLNRRVEVCFPIEQPDLAQRVLSELELYLADGRQRWELLSDGVYVQSYSPDHNAAQLELLRQYTLGPRVTPVSPTSTEHP
jgi:polyphosphate kinase